MGLFYYYGPPGSEQGFAFPSLGMRAVMSPGDGLFFDSHYHHCMEVPMQDPHLNVTFIVSSHFRSCPRQRIHLGDCSTLHLMGCSTPGPRPPVATKAPPPWPLGVAGVVPRPNKGGSLPPSTPRERASPPWHSIWHCVPPGEVPWEGMGGCLARSATNTHIGKRGCHLTRGQR